MNGFVSNSSNADPNSMMTSHLRLPAVQLFDQARRLDFSDKAQIDKFVGIGFGRFGPGGREKIEQANMNRACVDHRCFSQVPNPLTNHASTARTLSSHAVEFKKNSLRTEPQGDNRNVTTPQSTMPRNRLDA